MLKIFSIIVNLFYAFELLSFFAFAFVDPFCWLAYSFTYDFLGVSIWSDIISFLASLKGGAVDDGL